MRTLPIVQAALSMMTELVHTPTGEDVEVDLTPWIELSNPERAACVGVLLGALHGALTITAAKDDTFDPTEWTAALAARLTLQAMTEDQGHER